MPQLDPSPWLITMVFSWVIFIFIIPGKVLNHKPLNNPALLDFMALQNKLWFWPW
uniref:ATP synthase complex subunit 8 n=1 Tax=Entelurus aequoreus TaxID=161455 RepID=A0A6B9SB48_9TELE|nr:ATP synthase F0 subunit 8 [Entelurus aequoreus]